MKRTLLELDVSRVQPKIQHKLKTYQTEQEHVLSHTAVWRADPVPLHMATGHTIVILGLIMMGTNPVCLARQYRVIHAVAQKVALAHVLLLTVTALALAEHAVIQILVIVLVVPVVLMGPINVLEQVIQERQLVHVPERKASLVMQIISLKTVDVQVVRRKHLATIHCHQVAAQALQNVIAPAPTVMFQVQVAQSMARSLRVVLKPAWQHRVIHHTV